MTEQATETTPSSTSTETPTPPMMNSPEARTETGEIKPQPSTLSTEPASEAPAPVVPAGAPDKYEFTAPEGTTLDPAIVDGATPIFRELGLDQAGAQKLVDFYNKSVGDISKLASDAVVAMRTEWRTAVTSDPEMGPAMDRISADVGRMKAMLPADVREAFNEAMNLTGAGDHPAIVKALWKLSQYVTEGKPVSGGGPSPHGQTESGKVQRPSAAAAIYPNLSR